VIGGLVGGHCVKKWVGNGRRSWMEHGVSSGDTILTLRQGQAFAREERAANLAPLQNEENTSPIESVAF
jgi:hypothetical protein